MTIITEIIKNKIVPQIGFIQKGGKSISLPFGC